MGVCGDWPGAGKEQPSCSSDLGACAEGRGAGFSMQMDGIWAALPRLVSRGVYTLAAARGWFGLQKALLELNQLCLSLALTM